RAAPCSASDGVPGASGIGTVSLAVQRRAPMTRYSVLTPLMVALGLAAGCAGQPEHVHSTSPVAGASAPGAPQLGGPPPLWKNLGAYSHPITTISPRSQAYFDQGLRLTYGFNHAEAQRSFREAARVDPSCAMCQWGIAITYGSNYNDPTNPDREQGALAAAQKAQALAARATPAERAIIDALAKRHQPGGERAALDRVYADAMRDVAQR